MMQTEGGASVQVLLAEDDEVCRDIVQAFLGGYDVQITIAADGRQAMDVALARKFDLMIVDQNMPYLVGDRLIRHLRATRSLNASTPAIRFTAEIENKPIDFEAIVGRLDVTLAKPISREVLLATVSAVLHQH